MSAFFVGGTKGGVGKSLVSCLVLHKFISDGEKPILVETDDSNPDVMKIYKKRLSENNNEENVLYTSMDTEKGWQKVFKKIYDLRENNSLCPIVINTGARNITSIEKYGMLFDGIGDITTLWVIDNGKDSLNLLYDYLKVCHQKITVVKNGFFGEEEDFEFFDKSHFNDKENVIPNVYLSKAPLGIVSALQNRIPFDQMAESLHIVDRILAQNWLEKSTKIIKNAIEIAQPYTLKV